MRQIRRSSAIICFSIFICLTGKGQDGILEERFTFNRTGIKTGQVLKIIARATGYHFTYDTRIIDIERQTDLIATNETLRDILSELLEEQSFHYSVIGRHIIITQINPTGAPPAPLKRDDGLAYHSITGIVVDNNSGDPLAYATIAVYNRPRGTTSNSEGQFILNIEPEFMTDTLIVSYIGYVSQKIPLDIAPGNRYTIRLFRDFIPLPEVIIRSQIPQELIRRTVMNIPYNYGTTPVLMTAFYREGIIKGRELQVYSEAILDIYKTSYTIPGRDQIRVVRSRKIENINRSDTLMLRLKAGLGSSLLLDGIKNRYEFLNELNFDQYRFIMTDIVTIGESTAYVIEFEQMDDIYDPLFRGVLMINTSDHALMNAEFEIHPTHIEKTRDIFIAGNRRGYSINPVSAKYRVSYRKMPDRYYISHVRGDLSFSARKPRRLFRSSYDVFFELAVTSVKGYDVTPFERDETIPLQTVFSRETTGYDTEFWEGFNFLSPEDNLLNALDNITIRLSRYLNGDR